MSAPTTDTALDAAIPDAAQRQVARVGRQWTDHMSQYVQTAQESRAVRELGDLCGSPTGCFTPETLVVMADGSRRRMGTSSPAVAP